MERYAGLPPLPARIERLPELALDLWWSWHGDARAGVPAPRLRAVARDGAQPGADAAGCCRATRSSEPRSDPGVSAALRPRRSPRSTPRARRTTRGGRSSVPALERPVDRLLLRGVRAAPVAADLRRRPRRARRRSLQGSERPRRAAHRRRLHVSAGLLPPAHLRRRLAGGKLRAAELGRRADRAGADRRRQAVHHGGAARRPHGARRGLARARSAASRSTCSTPTSKRTRRGTASCRRASTAATAKRACSRRSSSASAASARLKALGSSPARLPPQRRARRRSSCCSASAISIEQGAVVRRGARRDAPDHDLHDAHAGACRPRRVSVPAGGKAPRRLLGHARHHTATAFLALGQYDNGNGPQFNMTALAMRSAGVGQRRQPAARRGHARDVGADVAGRPESKMRPVTAITNGVHVPTWVSNEMAQLSRRAPRRGLDRSTRRPGVVGPACSTIPDDELWAVRSRCAVSVRVHPRARAPALDRRAGQRRAGRRGRHAARPRRADDRLRAAVHRLQASRAGVPRPRAAGAHPERRRAPRADRVRRQSRIPPTTPASTTCSSVYRHALDPRSAAASRSSTTTTCTSRTSWCRAATSG